LVEKVACDDAEVVIMCMGSIGSEAKLAVEALRERGRRVGLARVRVFRPFPSNELKRVMSGVEAVAVLDRAISFGMEGQLFTEAKASLYDLDQRPSITGFITGIGGRDVTRTDIEEMALKALENARAGKPYQRLVWPQLKS
jgi:pyruvate ferredoxin oxidoreductase alpha subunit